MVGSGCGSRGCRAVVLSRVVAGLRIGVQGVGFCRRWSCCSDVHVGVVALLWTVVCWRVGGC